MQAKTSLSRQLLALQTASVSQVAAVKRVKASLLFDPDEVANYEVDDFFETGLRGIKELGKIDSKFSAYEASLFSAESKKFQRLVETKETNRSVSKLLCEFLSLVSPYFHLLPSQEAVEWLIFRYRIHEFEADAFLSCILPHHDSKLFVRALQLLKIKEQTHKFHWLYGNQKNGVTLSKPLVCTRAATDVAFLKFVLMIWKNTLKAHEHRPEAAQSIVSFVTSTIMGSLETSPLISEVQTSTVINAVVPRLSNRADRQSHAGALMILGQLIRKASLSLLLLETLVTRLSEDLSDIGNLKMLVILYQHQQANLTHFPSKAYPFVCANAAGLVDMLNAVVAGGFRVSPFFSVLVGGLVAQLPELDQVKSKQIEEVIATLVNEVRVQPEDSKALISAMLGAIMEHLQQHGYEKTISAFLRSVLLTCERVYPSSYDEALRDVFQLKNEDDAESSERAKKKLCALLGFDSSLLEGDGTTLFMKLHNSESLVREKAVAALISALNSGKAAGSESALGYVLDALQDPNPSVLSEALKIGPSVLDLPVEKVTKCLQKILRPTKTGDTAEWAKVERQAIDLLCTTLYPKEKTSNMSADIMLSLVPHFFLKSSKALSAAAKTPFGEQFDSLAKLASQNLEGRTELLRTVKLFGADKESHKLFIQKVVEGFEATDDAVQLVSYILFLATQELSLKQSAIIVDGLLKNIDKIMDVPKVLDASGSLDIPSLMKSVNKLQKIPTELVLYFTCEVVKSKLDPKASVMDHNQSLERDGMESAIRLFGLTLNLWMSLIITRPKTMELRKTYMNKFITAAASERKDQLKLLMPFWTGQLCSTPVSTSLQIQAMVLSLALLKQSLDMSYTQLSSPVVPSLLCSLSSSSSNVRKIAVSILLELKQTLTGGLLTDSFAPLVSGLLRRKEELLADESQLPVVMNEVFTGDGLSAVDRKKVESIRELLFSDVLSENTPAHIKAGLLIALKLTVDKESTLALLELAKSSLQSAKTKKLPAAETLTLKLILQRYQPDVADIVETEVGWNVFCMAVRQAESIFEIGAEKFSAEEIILQQVTKEFFAALPNDGSRSKLLIFLFDVLSSEEISGEGANRIRKCIKHLVIDAAVVVQMFAIKAAEVSRDAKSQAVVVRQRKSEAARLDSDPDFKRAMVAIEIFQNKRRISNTHLLVQPLIGLLRKCVLQTDHVAYEYSKQLILSCLNSFITKLEPAELSQVKGKIDVDLLVQCVNFSHNPQTHHHALLLLSQAARLFPEIVLEKMMSIFTSMGNTILKRDDDYSLQVIDKTLTALIPELIKANEDPNDPSKLNNIINNIVFVFTKSIHETPRYRQILTFNKLLSIVGPEQHLWLGPAHLMQIAASQTDKAKREQLRKSALEVCTLFDVRVQLKAVHDLLKYIGELPMDLDPNKPIKPVFGPWTFVGEKTELRCAAEVNFLVSLRSNILQLLAYLLQSHDLLEKLASDTPGVDAIFSALVTAVTSTIRKFDEFYVKKGRKQEKIRALLVQAQDVMDKINSLLKSDMFLEVIFSLLKSGQDMQKRALDLLVVKLEAQATVFSEGNRLATLTQISEWLIQFVTSSTSSSKTAESVALNLQSAINVLIHVSHVFALDSTTKILPILDLSSSLVTRSESLPIAVLGQTLLCLGEAVRMCGASSLVAMTGFMPHLLRILQEDQKIEENEILLTAAISSLQKIVDTLPQFLSPYLRQLLVIYCHFSAIYNVESNGTQKKQEKLSRLQSELVKIRTSFANNVPLRSLVPCLTAVYDELDHKERRHLFSLLQETFKNSSKEDVIGEIEALTNFFLEGLDFRAVVEQPLSLKSGKKKRKLEEPQVPDSDVNVLESSVADSFVSMVMKLPETHFRPLYYKLYDWMQEGEDKKERMLTFYRLSGMIADKIKGLFSLFAGQIVKHVTDLLKSISEEVELFKHRNVEKSEKLLTFLLGCLTKIALYDNEQFFNKDRFELLMKPIVNQLENCLGGEQKATERNENLVAPLISQFALALADDLLWKDLHYHVLLKMRDDRAWVRIGALKAYSSLVSKLGKDDYLPLLPEAIPFLAELLEDTENSVEVLAQQVIQDTETIVGEPLRDYF